MKKKLKTRDIIQLCAMGLIGASVLTANVILNVPIGDGIKLSSLITNYLYGSGINYENSETFKEAIAQSKDLNIKIGEEGIVMVRNERNTLPIAKESLKKINVFGWSSTKGGWVCGSDGSANSNSGASRLKVKDLITVLNDPSVGIETNTELTKMYEDFCKTRATDQSGNLIRALAQNPNYYQLTEPTRDYYDRPGANGKTILENAKNFSSTALVVLSRLGGEGTDLPYKQIKNDDGKKTYVGSDFLIDDTRTYLDVTTEEEAMLKMCKDNFEKVIVLVNSCNEMNLKFLEDYDIDACLTVNGLGENGAFAIPKILTGETNPSGKTTSTHPYDLSLDASFANGGAKTADSQKFATYLEDIYVGYKWFETADAMGYWNDVSNQYGNGYDGVVQYPFGYGLSYSKFQWELAELSAIDQDGNRIKVGEDFIDENTKFTVKVNVTNNSDIPGKDVVQLYVNPPYYQRGIEKSSVNLLAFAKTGLIPAHKSSTVTLTFSGYDFASYDCYDKNTNHNVGYELDRGTYRFSLRTDSHTLANMENNEFDFNLKKTVRITNDPKTGTRVTNRFTDYSVVSKQEDGTFDTKQISAYGGSAIDGNNLDGDHWTYLTRADFNKSFPKTSASARGGKAISDGLKHVYGGIDESKIPEHIYGSASTHYWMYTTSNGEKASKNDLDKGNVVPNKDLLMELGADYDNAKWEDLLNQMSQKDINTLVNRGGYCTLSIESVGKKFVLENDGPAGLNRHNMEIDNTASRPDKAGWTMFSMPATIGTSWDTNLAYSFGKSIGAEATAVGVGGWYAPGANMQRSPFGGRNSEYYSEDSLLSGKMAASSSKGSTSMGVNTYVKHFVVNDQEQNRAGLKTYLSEQALREIYLKPFEIAVKEGDATGIMSSFNLLGTIWTGANYALCTEILRNEWGFRGSVITDYYAGKSLMPLKAGLIAGNDLWLTGGQSNAEEVNFSDKIYAHFARNSAKNILYSNARAYYLNQTRDASLDTISVDINQVIVREVPFPWWIIWGVLPLDVVTVAGLGVWAYFVLRTPKKKKEQ